jgi:CheY-like chemotaxis protein
VYVFHRGSQESGENLLCDAALAVRITFDRQLLQQTPHLQLMSVRSRPTIRELVCEVLTQAGYDTLHAGDGSAGLRILQSGTTIIDVLITDVGLPGAINGRQMA